MIDFSKVIEAMKEIQPWRFILLWIWLMVIALTALLHAVRWW